MFACFGHMGQVFLWSLKGLINPEGIIGEYELGFEMRYFFTVMIT